MENARKNLKDFSYLVLFFAAYSLVRVIWSAIATDFNVDALPEGTTDSLILAGKIVLCVVSLIFLLPQIYVGFKGIKVAKTPDKSKAHIVWQQSLQLFQLSASFPQFQI